LLVSTYGPVYALPVFAGLNAALAAFHEGAGPVGAATIGVLTSATTLTIGHIVFATVRTSFTRVAVGLLFAVPATVAGYYSTIGLANLVVPSGGWREAFAAVGAFLIGGVAWVRMPCTHS
jgi:hypothetical protein